MDGSGPGPASRGPAVAEAFGEALGQTPLSAEAAAFLEQALADYRPEELPGWSTAHLAEALAFAWRAAADRGSEPVVQLERAAAQDAGGRPLDLLAVAQPDRPFLVDSTMAELVDQGLDVRAMFHPIVGESEDRRSTLLVVLGAVAADRRAALVEGVRQTLADVKAAVEDFPSMAERMRTAIDELAAAEPAQGPELEEQLAFLRWLTADRFVFLGARDYVYPRDPSGGYVPDQPQFSAETCLGVLRDQDRSVLRRASEPAVLAKSARDYLRDAPALVVAKSNLRSRVHRRAYMDYIGVRRYGPDGSICGEVRFVGLFTAEAYEEPARTLPLIRRKVAAVLAQAAEGRSGHAGRRLRHIVETYPRDELFQIAVDELAATAIGVLHLYDRPRLGLFARKDPFDRFLSVLLFLPRDRYDSDLQARAGAILARAWGGRVSAVYPSFADGPLARLHYVIGLDPGDHPEPNLADLEAELVEAARTWTDRFETSVREAAEGAAAAVALSRWRPAFPAGYRDRNDAADALADLDTIDAWAPETPLRVRIFRREGDEGTSFRFKLYVRERPAPLSDVLAVMEHMGLRALQESGFRVSPATEGPGEGSEIIWIHEYHLQDAYGRAVALDDIETSLAEAFAAVWTGQAESDGFNRLVLDLGASWREAALVRALARWRQQSGLESSQSVQEQALRDHPGVARLILDLFRIKFDPAVQAAPAERLQRSVQVIEEIEAALQAVESLDADRVLRRLARAVAAMTRTNYFQLGADGAPKPYISFKIDSRRLDDLPAPKPYREIFVAGPRVEGVHLRFGPIARGGLRWSDRRDDFRTEVLGLVKAQQVKNAVIVPVGAKGGFYPKRLPREEGPEAVRAEGLEAYKLFLAGLLDLTDNLDSEGNPVRPEGVMAHDPDDPYLVVAADKGTATFSDTANGVAESRGFWLGDAFASGGSAGYDHKAMGITARGAWEAVKRHFRELDKDIQAEPFTCVGVGDMSGDVFGNGMLLSRAIKLVAAFDHRHIFLDPNPDPAAAWEERSRLFQKPASSWADYDPKLISWGGGVHARSLKSVPVSPEVQAALDFPAETATPAELIQAILRAPVELLYLGGIGTYVKAAGESHAEASDKTNDAVRIDAGELRCQVVGEGANLGFTQSGRIAFARAGGRINTDAIDNSAGVDTSDHEVNLKILLGQIERAGRLDRAGRDALLREMTEEVASRVLAHNYAQTLALSLEEAAAPALLDAHARFMADLAAKGRLDRRVEGLPGPAAIVDLKAQGLGLTRPELAVLLAYAKLELSAELVDCEAPDDPHFERALQRYFPSAVQAFDGEMRAHRLKREIIAAVIANDIVDMTGPTFALRLRASTGCDTTALAIGFEAAREVFGLDSLWGDISALDLQISAQTQTVLYQAVAKAIRAQTYWLAFRAARRHASMGPVRVLVERYRPGARTLMQAGAALLSPFEAELVARRAEALTEDGAPAPLAAAVAGLSGIAAAIEIVDLAHDVDWPVDAAARVFQAAGGALGIDRLRATAAALPAADSFERTALRGQVMAFIEAQTAVARGAMAIQQRPVADAEAASRAVEAWLERRRDLAERLLGTVREIEATGEPWSFAKLTLIDAALRRLLG